MLKYLPHRTPILLVDTYFGRDDEASFTGFTPVSGSLFCPGDFFLEEGIIEHAAQSVALAAGMDSVAQGTGVVPGYVGALGPFTFYSRVQAGEELVTAIREIHKYPSFSVIHIRTDCGKRQVAEGELKVVKFNTEGALEN